jgi:hypothetical protein
LTGAFRDRFCLDYPVVLGVLGRTTQPDVSDTASAVPGQFTSVWCWGQGRFICGLAVFTGQRCCGPFGEAAHENALSMIKCENSNT